MQTVEVEYSGQIQVNAGKNPRELYAHQNEAIKALDQKNKSPFEGLLVLPTGGGKTLIAINWLLRNFIDKRKKVLWIAHRHELLDQAFETLKFSADPSLLNNVEKFRYRVISGHPKHDRPVNIQPSDDIIIASKDSLNSGLNHLLDNWVKHSDAVLLVVDEAHHATAKTYRKLIDDIKQNFKDRGKADSFRMLGLTATPFRTDKGEQGLLKKVFPDDIIFSEHLRTLITRGILAEPIFENLETELDFYRELTDKDIKAIENFDKLPKKIAEKIAMSNIRNKGIVDHYVDHQEKYKPLLVFAVDIQHAIALNSLFQKRGINSDFVASKISDANTGATVSVKENSEKIKRFRKGELEVLINVEMLTEGTDLPNVQTVFLTRPTTSTILMTQMIGRALRGKKAGGTEKAYVVSFIDNWEDKINWVNPEKLIVAEVEFPDDKDIETMKRIARLISIEKIEEFTRMMDDSIDTTDWEKLDFLRRVPVGIYCFSILEPSESGEPLSRNYDVLLYNDTEEAYDSFVNDLESVFKSVDIENREILTDEELKYLLQLTKKLYFPDHSFLLGYRDADVENILRFYAQKQMEPEFIAFSERRKCDLSIVARHIYENDLTLRQVTEYLTSLWNDTKSFWQVLFGYNYLYFKKQVDIEINKLLGVYPDLIVTPPIVIPDTVPLESLSLVEIRERDPAEYRDIKDAVFAKYTNTKGFINCAMSEFKSQMRRDFQIDHIIPMSKGGLTTLDNLQVLSRKAHTEKTRLENLKTRI
ncbi:MAG: DEAD/DEAH box helicase family protein [Nostoc sp. EfeVER01]|uniref:DEAD/DEAH box helicase family protein n=1 Tax=unclassified Nostoc TaxID=2593658 RepID=UPI002AD5202C|nr:MULTISPECIES: DEAD/DEAH box helicase family protein [unclassified Nostoc]MDZ7947166.1 DEAD/DEAH box helicase family protein [Nostoc sp. EfeVER01]MDZ7994691.1 DEAD/DEAH box helicase family protein [Nostoc sp. EspVER01]